MKKNIVIIFWLLVSSAAYAQKNKTADIIINEVKSFIDTIKPASILGGKYNVYVVKLRKSKNEGIYFSTSYITNDYDLDYIHANYYLKIGNEIILLDIEDNLQGDFSNMNITKISKLNKDIITNKLFKQEDGGIIVDFREGEIGYIHSGILHKRFYKNSDEIPDDFSVFDRSFLDSIIIRKIPHPELPPDHPSNRSPYFPLNGR